MNVYGPIVLEGPDGAGKTTLAAELVKAGLVLVKNGPPPPGGPDYAAQLAPERVLDRSWPSEMAYGPLLRGASLVDRYQAHELEYDLETLGGLMVFCLPPLAVCLDRWEKRHAQGGELLTTATDLRRVYAWYEGYAAAYSGRCMIYNWWDSRQSADTVLQETGKKMVMR